MKNMFDQSLNATRVPFLKALTAVALLAAVPVFPQTPAAPQGTGRQGAAGASGAPKPQDTEVWEPVPKVVTPGATNAEPPSDAIVLFDGKNLDEWETTK